jgi:hypothetical protein
MAFRASGRERQHGIEAVQSLDRRLFIDGKHDRVLRWILRYSPMMSAAFGSKSGSSDSM